MLSPMDFFIAQGLEQLAVNQLVVGSNPTKEVFKARKILEFGSF